MKQEIIHMRGFKKVYMITVLEGTGVTENPYREVRYFYDNDTDRFLGKHDPAITPSEEKV